MYVRPKTWSDLLIEKYIRMRPSPLPRACAWMDKLRLPVILLPAAEISTLTCDGWGSNAHKSSHHCRLDSLWVPLAGSGGYKWSKRWRWRRVGSGVGMGQSIPYCNSAGHRTHPLTWICFKLHYQIVLQGGGNGDVHKQEWPRTCTVPQRVPHSYCLFIQCGVEPHKVLETNLQTFKLLVTAQLCWQVAIGIAHSWWSNEEAGG